MNAAETLTPPELNTLSIDVDGEIGTLTLNRPKVLNAMSPESDRGAGHRRRMAGRPGPSARPDRDR